MMLGPFYLDTWMIWNSKITVLVETQKSEILLQLKNDRTHNGHVRGVGTLF